MTLFGEEVGAVRRFKYAGVLDNREDLLALKHGSGAGLAKFYSAINTLRTDSAAVRGRNIRVLHVHDANRMLVFKRWLGDEALLIFASLNDQPFASGYSISHPLVDDGGWREVFNSDAAEYGGANVGNAGATLQAINGTLAPVVPHAGLVVFRRVH
jgi:1,4-alpha-glucan branching enzyme